MESCIRIKHPLAMTKPIFFPAAVLPLSQAYSDVFLTQSIQTHSTQFATSNISLGLLAHSNFYLCKLILGLNTLWGSCGDGGSGRRATKVTQKRGSGFSWSQEQGGLVGYDASVETEISQVSNHFSLSLYTLLKVLMWNSLSHVTMNWCYICLAVLQKFVKESLLGL